LKIQDNRQRHFKNLTNCNHLTNIDENWHGDASGTPTANQPLKFTEFENPECRTAAILKIRKIVISPQPFDQF